MGRVAEVRPRGTEEEQAGLWNPPYLSKPLWLFEAVFLSVNGECVRNCTKVTQGRGFEDRAEQVGQKDTRVALRSPWIILESISKMSLVYRLMPVLGIPASACSASSGQAFPQRVNSPLYLQLHFKDTKLKQVIYSPHTRKSN